MAGKPRIAVASPFLDKQHGTERCIVEQLDRLADDYEIHIYSARVEDLAPEKFIFHRIPRLPGPHLLGYLWWFAANQLRRSWDRRIHGLVYDLTFSPGINCLDADVIAVHVVFAEFRRQVRNEMKLGRNPLRSWPLLIHRRLYYRFFEALERWVYTREDLPLVVVSRKVAASLARFYGRKDGLYLIYNALDLDKFQPARRERLRMQARQKLQLKDECTAVLLVGNDWKSKGLPCLLEAAGKIPAANLHVLVVGRDTEAPYEAPIRRLGLEGRIHFLAPRADVEFYYAAADMYAGPSLEDAFGLPPAEAMACGLPVIVSRRAGVSELVTHGVDGFILEDPSDSRQLAEFIRQLYEDANLRRHLGGNAARKTQEFTWERNCAELKLVLDKAIQANRQKRARLAPDNPGLETRKIGSTNRQG